MYDFIVFKKECSLKNKSCSQSYQMEVKEWQIMQLVPRILMLLKEV